ncbi:acyltransferase family protein [Xylella fastidiosa]|uniref:acyltransferase family protein n=1 Tax=Xylella fastidiosa TaxID=2371 RepID=UPI000057B6C9|nr:acyltransferase family protein [Xylella fastidiosa]UIX80750.1 acyltransferase family protein [Xylella fastidiosa subsp. sandyi]
MIHKKKYLPVGVGTLAHSPGSLSVGRDARIDAAKGLGIFLVVLGHAKGLPEWWVVLIYSFHVPLFFLLSGWAAGTNMRQSGFCECLLHLMRTLLVPYVFFFFVGYIYWLLTRHIGAKDLRWGMHPWWEPLNGLLMGGGTALYVQPSLWFLPALFVTKLTYQVLSKYVSLERLVLFGGIFSWVWVGFFPGFGVRFPFALDELPIAFLFFVLGVMGRRTSWLRLLPKTRKANMILLAVLLFPWFLLALCNEKVDMNMLIFGNSPFIFHVSALLGVAIVLCMAALVEQWSLVQWAGRNTLLILCTHTLVFFVLFGVLSLLGGTSGLILALLFSAITLCFIPIFRWILMRWIPWSLGACSYMRARSS